ncbi:aminopeptidase P family protein [Spiroplasma endosymbiont of Crioceris asparagi]|uniref:aminopeptidase P family protein n=1 Tax=Spiroplasma endosymbiont of Crioceris asparagi TaxID=3066286 RepID=UPI0030D32E3B
MKKQLLNDILKTTKADGILIYSPQNRFWFSRFNSSYGFILYTANKTTLILDGRYITMARESKMLQNIDDLVLMKDPYQQLNELIKAHNIKTLLFESDWINFSLYETFKQKLAASLQAYDFVKLRMCKDQWEIDQIKKACDITHEVLKEVLDFIKVGMSEKEVARFVSDTFLKHGASKLSFDTIVASGPLNGSMPHAVPTDRIIEANDFVTLDMGCYFNGYCSDQTRTFAMSKNVDNKLKEIYQVVYDAQQKGIDAIKPGVSTGEIHKICFDHINEQGYGEYFTHGTGHGLGIEIHEWPYNAKGHNELLQPGMTVTIEPGIYIPGVGGVRIEDDILVTKTGHEFLTTPFRDLQIISK